MGRFWVSGQKGAIVQSFTLRDGRTLAFDDVGDPAGYPVVWHHGSMTCRLLRHPDDSLAAGAGLRLVCADRPGYGDSSPQPGRTLQGWADDIEQLADHLGLGRFAVAGASAGGPNALAVAHGLGDRVSHGVLASSLGPLEEPEALGDLDRMMALPFRFLRFRWLLRLPLASAARQARTNPSKWVDQWERSSSPADRAVFVDPTFRSMLERQTPVAWRSGPQGLIDDLAAIHVWGFSPEDVDQHIDVFHGDSDTTVSPAMGARLAARLPNSDLQVIPNQGHMLFLASWDSIMQALAEGQPLA
jgi:pimeloyl-ACP methyl ester carboxylesterase